MSVGSIDQQIPPSQGTPPPPSSNWLIEFFKRIGSSFTTFFCETIPRWFTPRKKGGETSTEKRADSVARLTLGEPHNDPAHIEGDSDSLKGKDASDLRGSPEMPIDSKAGRPDEAPAPSPASQVPLDVSPAVSEIEACKEEWRKNFESQAGDSWGKNFSILDSLIKNKSISDQQLYQFMKDLEIKASGGWFFYGGIETELANTFKSSRGKDVATFFNEQEPKEMIRTTFEQWEKVDFGTQKVMITSLIKNKNISDDDLIAFFESKNITYIRPFYPRSNPFLGRDIQRFSGYLDLPKKIQELSSELDQGPLQQALFRSFLKTWVTNAEKATQAQKEGNDVYASTLQAENYSLLEKLITSKNVTDEQLYQFFIESKVQVSGGWLFKEGEPTELNRKLSESRGCPVAEFFKKEFLKSAKERFEKEPLKQAEILRSVVAHSLVSDDEVREFIHSLKIDVQALLLTKVDELFLVHRGRFFAEFMRSPVVQAAAPVDVSAKIAITDPLQHMITLNSHGAYSSKKFTLPANVYVLAPHPQGFDQPYVVESPPGGQSFEEMIYRKDGGPQQFITPSSGGWKLYTPGEEIHNLQLSPWSPSACAQDEFDSWSQRVSSQDAQQVLTSNQGSVPRFSLVPARDSSQHQYEYGQKMKEKVKVFSSTDLQTVIETLHKAKPGEPIVLIPFACNYRPGMGNPSVRCDLSRKTNLKKVF